MKAWLTPPLPSQPLLGLLAGEHLHPNADDHPLSLTDYHEIMLILLMLTNADHTDCQGWRRMPTSWWWCSPFSSAAQPHHHGESPYTTFIKTFMQPKFFGENLHIKNMRNATSPLWYWIIHENRTKYNSEDTKRTPILVTGGDSMSRELTLLRHLVFNVASQRKELLS